jgi:hypothetical protein
LAEASKTLRSLGAPDCPVVHQTVSGGAPDSVRCARLALVKLATLGILSAAYDYNSSDCPVVHRTVRWCTRLSGEPTVGRAIRA